MLSVFQDHKQKAFKAIKKCEKKNVLSMSFGMGGKDVKPGEKWG